MPLLDRTIQYLRETLGLPVAKLDGHLEIANRLPVMLSNVYELQLLSIYGHPVLLVLDESGDRSPKRIERDVTTYRQHVRDVIYVTASITSYDRKRLIERRLAFIVPDNQVFLPELGLVLREYARRDHRGPVEKMSPSAQAMLLVALRENEWARSWEPSAMAARLGYTPMTASRASYEIAGLGLASMHKVGRAMHLVMTQGRRETWRQAMTSLRSPVQRTVWVPADTAPPHVELRLAGLDALAQRTMLADPLYRVYALTRDDFKSTGVRTLPHSEGAQEWQVWHYPTTLDRGSPAVDPLSLILSLRDDPDERVQMAVDELEGSLPW